MEFIVLTNVIERLAEATEALAEATKAATQVSKKRQRTEEKAEADAEKIEPVEEATEVSEKRQRTKEKAETEAVAEKIEPVAEATEVSEKRQRTGEKADETDDAGQKKCKCGTDWNHLCAAKGLNSTGWEVDPVKFSVELAQCKTLEERKKVINCIELDGKCLVKVNVNKHGPAWC